MLAIQRLSSWLIALRRRTLSFSSLGVLFALGLGLSFAIASCSPQTSVTPQASPSANPPQAKVVRIGHQKFDPFTLVIAFFNWID